MPAPINRKTSTAGGARCIIACTLLALLPWSSNADNKTPANSATPATTTANSSQAAATTRCDFARGKRVFSKCAMCHAREKNAASLAGPNLFGVVNRPAGRAPGFRYSRAMANYRKPWTVAELDRFLGKPATVIPGTAMAFAGLAKQEDRAAVICVLQLEK